MNADPIIQIQNLTLQTGSNRLLTNINWTINRGENWIVFGRNGSGKTTLLSTLVGFHKFQRGSLKINGIEFSAENMLQLRQEIGWVSSSFFAQYYRNEKVLDIVLSSWTGTLGVSSFPEDRAVVRAKQLLTDLGLRAKIEMPYSTLSKGEQQKVIIARAFLTDPKILIFDEPEVLIDHSHPPTEQGDAAGLDVAQVEAIHHGTAPTDRFLSGEQFQDGGFAGAGRAHDGEIVALLDLQVDVFQNADGLLALRIILADILHFNEHR